MHGGATLNTGVEIIDNIIFSSVKIWLGADF